MVPIGIRSTVAEGRLLSVHNSTTKPPRLDFFKCKHFFKICIIEKNHFTGDYSVTEGDYEDFILKPEKSKTKGKNIYSGILSKCQFDMTMLSKWNLVI